MRSQSACNPVTPWSQADRDRVNLLATMLLVCRPQLTSSAVASALTAAIISTTHTPHHPTLALTTVATALISSSTAT
jgi:hypothetical protein